MKKIIHTFWLGSAEMSVNRVRALWSILVNSGCPINLIKSNEVRYWSSFGRALHPAFDYLSPVHQADYLRCYFMHNFGGGYTDIKYTSCDWKKFFDTLESSDAIGLGYPEIHANAIAKVGGQLQIDMQNDYGNLIGYCAFMFKKNTSFTREWLDETEKILTEKYHILKDNPAKHVLDQYGLEFADGTRSSYPLSWTEIGGNVFHPLVYANKDKILKHAIAPSFVDYR